MLLKKYKFDVERLVGKRRRPDKMRKVIGSADLEKKLVSNQEKYECFMC